MLKKIRDWMYNSETKRLIFRFVEIFLLAGFSAVLKSVELENALIIGLGSGVTAMLLKFLRDITNEQGK